MREIKFRAWFVEDKEMDECTRIDLPNQTHHDKVITMQYTGLKDKNGKEIYESDVIKFSSDWDEHEVVVEFYGGGFRFGKELKGELGINDDSCIPDFNCEYEVIGNIYESPELLEVNDGLR